MNAGQLAALIAAGFFAVGVCAAVYVLARLARLISAATATVNAYSDSADELMRQARAVVARADEQLASTGAITDSVDQVTASMSELSEQVAAVTGTARLIAAGLGTPVLRLAAAGHGVRRAIAIRRSASGRALASVPRAAEPQHTVPSVPGPPGVAAPVRMARRPRTQAPALNPGQQPAQAPRREATPLAQAMPQEATPQVQARRRTAARPHGTRMAAGRERAQR